MVIFNFSIKAQVGRLMVAICSFGCASESVDLTPSLVRARVARITARRSQLLTPGEGRERRRRIPFGAAGRARFWDEY